MSRNCLTCGVHYFIAEIQSVHEKFCLIEFIAKHTKEPNTITAGGCTGVLK